jgi:glycine/D-amino acid oxidase-like deaminating enzyme
VKLHDKVRSDAALPGQAGAVVIGAGIIGIATALELRERGVDVVVVEKGEVAAEQSSRNWGWCRQMGRDPREIPLVQESLRLWRTMNQRVESETGFRQCGILYLSETQAQLAKDESWHQNHAIPNGLMTKMVTPQEIAGLVPGGTANWAGGMYTLNDCRAEPFIAVPAMARHLQKIGGRVFTQCAARGIETSTGRVSSVVTEKGAIATDAVILAGGYWSTRFLANHGLRFPQLGVVNSVMRTAPLDATIERTFAGGGFAVRKRMDGGYTLAHSHLSVAEITPAHFKYFFDFLPTLRHEKQGLRLRIGKRFLAEASLKRRWKLDESSPFELVRILDPEPVNDILAEVSAKLQAAYPAFKNAPIVERWAGMIDATPDAVPVIAPIQSQPGLFLASGFSGHGFGIGPGAGKLMADIVMGATPCVDPTPFRYERFIDGTKPRPQSGL